jgi:hypothetical protein
MWDVLIMDPLSKALWAKEEGCLRLGNLVKVGTCSALPFKKGRTSMLSVIPWITDSTRVQNIVIIAIVSNYNENPIT